MAADAYWAEVARLRELHLKGITNLLRGPFFTSGADVALSENMQRIRDRLTEASRVLCQTEGDSPLTDAAGLAELANHLNDMPLLKSTKAAPKPLPQLIVGSPKPDPHLLQRAAAKLARIKQEAEGLRRKAEAEYVGSAFEDEADSDRRLVLQRVQRLMYSYGDASPPCPAGARLVLDAILAWQRAMLALLLCWNAQDEKRNTANSLGRTLRDAYPREAQQVEECEDLRTRVDELENRADEDATRRLGNEIEPESVGQEAEDLGEGGVKEGRVESVGSASATLPEGSTSSGSTSESLPTASACTEEAAPYRTFLEVAANASYATAAATCSSKALRRRFLNERTDKMTAAEYEQFAELRYMEHLGILGFARIVTANSAATMKAAGAEPLPQPPAGPPEKNFGMGKSSYKGKKPGTLFILMAKLCSDRVGDIVLAALRAEQKGQDVNSVRAPLPVDRYHAACTRFRLDCIRPLDDKARSHSLLGKRKAAQAAQCAGTSSGTVKLAFTIPEGAEEGNSIRLEGAEGQGGAITVQVPAGGRPGMEYVVYVRSDWAACAPR